MCGSEADFNLFHIAGAQRLDPAELAKPATLTRLLTCAGKHGLLLGFQWRAGRHPGLEGLEGQRRPESLYH